MKSVRIGVILGAFAAIIFMAMTAVVVTFIVTNDNAIKTSIGTLVDNVMVRNVQVALRYVTFFETAVYQTASAVTTLNATALLMAAHNVGIGDLNASTAVEWAVVMEPMWMVLSLTGFPSSAALATFELWSPAIVSRETPAPGNLHESGKVHWDGAGCVPLSNSCFLYNSTVNLTMSAPVNDDHSIYYVDRATVRPGPPSFLHYTTDFIDHAFTDVHEAPSSEGQWSPLYITPSYAVTTTYCDGEATIQYLIFFVCLEYTKLPESGYSCVHGLGTMLTADALGQTNYSGLPTHSEMAVHSLKEVDGVNGRCNPDAVATEVLRRYEKTCVEDELQGKIISGVTGVPVNLSGDASRGDGHVAVPPRSVVWYSFCKPRAYLSSSEVISACIFSTRKGLSFIFIDRTSRSFFFGAADRSKKVCLVLGCTVIVATFLMCSFFWLITTRPVRWICRGMQRAKTLATSEKDTLPHARWYTLIHEVAMLYTAYLDLRQALKELKAYVPQGLFIAPSDSSVLHPDAFMANLLGLDGYDSDEENNDLDDDDNDDEDTEEPTTGASMEDRDRPSLLFDANIANEQEMRQVAACRAQSISQDAEGSTVFVEPESTQRRRRRSGQRLSQLNATITTSAAPGFDVSGNVPLGARDSKEVESKGIVTIFGTSVSQQSTLRDPTTMRGHPPPALSAPLPAAQPGPAVNGDTPGSGAFWSGVPAVGGSASAAGGGEAVLGEMREGERSVSRGGIVALVPVQSSTGIGSIPAPLQGTQSHKVVGLHSGTSSTGVQALRAREAQLNKDGTAAHTVTVSFVNAASPEKAKHRAARSSTPTVDTAMASTTMPRSMDVDPSQLQLDLTRTLAVNTFRPVTCSFVFLSFSFRFIDAASLERDVSKLMDIIVRCALRLGGVLEIFRPDLVAISFGAQAMQSQHLQRAITCAASIYKMSPHKMMARTRMLVDSGAFFVGSCGAHERVSRVVFGDRFDIALDFLKLDLLLGRVILTDRVAVCLPAGAVTPVDYIIPLRNRAQGTQLFHLLDPKKNRDKSYRHGARQFREAFMCALEGRFADALQVLDAGGLHDPELADHLARAMKFLMATRPVRPRYCRFQLTGFELLGAVPREQVLKYQYDRLSLQQINPEQSDISIQFGLGESLSNSVDPNGLSRAIFGGGGDDQTASPLSPPTGAGERKDPLHAGATGPQLASLGAAAQSSGQPAFAASTASGHHRDAYGSAGDDDDDAALLDGLPPHVFQDHQGTTWHRMPKAIGAGAFAEVYMVVSNTGTLMAAKCIRLTSSNINLEDVVTEVNIACGLFNDFIVNYTGWSHTAGYLFLLMEYMPGGTLQRLISGFPKGMPMQLARHYAADTLKGLAYLHRHNIIHADLKPQNVLLSADGGCKLSDFGSSLTRGRALLISTDVFQLRGTPFYMSPEVASGASPSMRSDIWSYGVCLHELLTGSLPWKLKKLVQHAPSSPTGKVSLTVTADEPTVDSSPLASSPRPPQGPLQDGPSPLLPDELGNESRFSLNTSVGSGPVSHAAQLLVSVLPPVAVSGASPKDQQLGTRTTSAGPSAVTFADGAAGAEATTTDPTAAGNGSALVTEVWQDLPAMSDARFVQGIITGEIAPRVMASTLPSVEAYHLILSCLRYNFKERPTAMELLNHPFFFA